MPVCIGMSALVQIGMPGCHEPIIPRYLAHKAINGWNKPGAGSLVDNPI